MKILKQSLFAVAATLLVSVAANAQDLTKKADAKPATAPMAAAPATAAVKTEVKEQKPTGLTFKEDTFNFGDIEKGKPATHEFTFKNTSNQTILITNVKASCGCTTPSYSKDPIKPGETGNVTATYNAANPGSFTKSITVTTNDTETPKMLTIKGKVDAPAEAAPAPAPNVSAAPAAKPAVVAKPAPVVEPGTQSYTVGEGDTLSKLAGKFYGNIHKYNVIFDANKGVIADSKLIYPGQVIKIPSAK